MKPLLSPALFKQASPTLMKSAIHPALAAILGGGLGGGAGALAGQAAGIDPNMTSMLGMLGGGAAGLTYGSLSHKGGGSSRKSQKQQLLDKIKRGEPLTKQDQANLEYLEYAEKQASPAPATFLKQPDTQKLIDNIGKETEKVEKVENAKPTAFLQQPDTQELIDAIGKSTEKAEKVVAPPTLQASNTAK